MSSAQPNDARGRQLKIALIIGGTKRREALQRALYHLSHPSAAPEMPQSPTVIHWPISEVEESDRDETRLRLKVQSANPLYIAAVKRLMPYLMRKGQLELQAWRMQTVQQRFAQGSGVAAKSVQYQHYFRVLNLVGRRTLLGAWTMWRKRVIDDEIEEAEETVVTVRRRVTVERITYVRERKTLSQPEVPTLEKLRKALLSSLLRDRAAKTRAFERFLRPKSLPSSKLPMLRKLLISARLRDKLVLLNALLRLKPEKVVTVALNPAYVQSVKAVGNLITYLLGSHVYTPVFDALRNKKDAEPDVITPRDQPISPFQPLDTQFSSPSPSKYSLRLVHFERKLWRLFRNRERWAFKYMMASHPKYQRRRFYRIQKGMKALYNASILAVQNDVFELLRFLLYIRSKKGKLPALPLFAYPTRSVATAQRLVRGFLARRYVRRLRKHKAETSDEMVMRYKGAVKAVVLAQKLVRGFLGRKLAAKLKSSLQSPVRASLRGQVMSSRLIMLVKALSRPVKRFQGLAFPKLSVKVHRKQIRRCIRLQRAAKEMQKALQTFGFRTIRVGNKE